MKIVVVLLFTLGAGMLGASPFITEKGVPNGLLFGGWMLIMCSILVAKTSK